MYLTARDLALTSLRWIDGHVDVWPIFRDARPLAAVVTELAEPFRNERLPAVCGVESHGFLLGGAVAVELGVGFVAVRKDGGLFPGVKVVRESEPDYRGLRHRLGLQRSSLGTADRVLMVDDWLETGSQARAVREAVEECGATWVGCGVIVDELADAARPRLGTVHSLLPARDIPPCPA